jgi:broad specificity phosphatase PhoE
MILLIRHAEKSLVGEQDLTYQGLVDALNYGVKLKQRGVDFDEIISSPVKRCVQTAEKVIEGMGAKLKVQQSPLLGHPGIFVIDTEKAEKIFDQLAVYEVINLLVKREKLQGFLSIDKAAKIMVNEIQEKISSGKSILYISHDTVIMPFIAYILNMNLLLESDIVKYLDGYRIENSGHKNSSLTVTPLYAKDV